MNDTISSTLAAPLAQQIRALCQQGYDLYDKNDYKVAIRHFFEAWNLLPKPQTQWTEAGWVLTALGDGYFKALNYKSGAEALKSALHCPGTANNPFIHLRLGQCLFEQQLFEQAKQQLSLAHQLGGDKLLSSEHPRYLELLNNSMTS